MDVLCEQCIWWLENGDGSHRLCTICHPEYASKQSTSSAAAISQHDAIIYPSDDIKFPDDNEVGDDDNMFTNAIPWRDVRQNVWLHVTDINNVNTVHGRSMIVTLRQRGNDDEIIRAWTTNIIAAAISKKEKQQSPQRI